MAIQFTAEEKATILELTQSYSQLLQKSAELAKKIEEAEESMNFIAEEMNQVQEHEYNFFLDLAAKYDVEPQTVQNAAANYVINPV